MTRSSIQPIEIGSQKQLFIDQRFIESSHGVKLCMNPPLKTEPVLVELLDERSLPIENFTMDDAVSVDRNGVAQEVWWQGGPDVPKLTGKPVRLRISMRSAKLYAFQFVEGKG